MMKSINRVPIRLLIGLCTALWILSGCLSNATPVAERAVTAIPTSSPGPTRTPKPVVETQPRGYQTTPQELREIAAKAEQGLEPYQNAVRDILKQASKDWNFELEPEATCPSADDPAWNDNGGGTPILYAKALAYQLTGEQRYAVEVKDILERIMTEVQTIELDPSQCQLNFGWGTPELVASADLIENYWNDLQCTGPTTTIYNDLQVGSGSCKVLFQNWLVKNPYYIVSLSAEDNMSNWGAAGTTTLAYIADYLWDRPDVQLVHRLPSEVSKEGFITYSPAEAFARATELALNRMNGYGIEYGSSNSCDLLGGKQQNPDFEPVKSQITDKGIIPEDARREEYCNIPQYNGRYQNYPQLHLGHNIQQCELMLRRGDSSCFDNVENTDFPDYAFIGPDGKNKTTHLYPGRGSIERAIKAIIVDSGTKWRHDSALHVAFRYYFVHHTLPGFDQWVEQLSTRDVSCSQDICFGALTHGFAIEEGAPEPPPTVPPP